MSILQFKKYEILVLGMIITALSCMTPWSEKAVGQERRYPNKPIEVIVNFPPGGVLDINTRILANEVSKDLGVPVSIQYKPGAGGVIGGTYVNTAKPDGYILLTSSGTVFTVAPFMEKDIPFDPLKGFTPIAYYGITPTVIATHSSSNLTSFDVLVKFAKEKPGAINCTTVGAGTMAHLLLEVLKNHGVNITHVPAKGGSPAVTNLLGKHVDLAGLGYAQVLPHVKGGALRILATTNKIAEEPGIPTFTEKGFSEIGALGIWYGFLGPPNLPKPICDQLANSIQKVIQMPSVVAELGKMGLSVEYKGPDEFKKTIAEDCRIIEKILKEAGLGKYSK
jgi:tripartite-type tricarboxylate transporter receptor subunit TctC